MSLNMCFICDKGFTEGNGVIVKRKGIITFLNSSFIRKDGKVDVIKNLEFSSHHFVHPLKPNCGPLNQHLILKSRVFIMKKYL
jgi:hypothetical protein